ncbi:MAG TPA: haloacid dehalogenase [Desulfobacteraceae bacterium]|nr:haloacid dehalogenase [Desulfobacteraceae bacterium]
MNFMMFRENPGAPGSQRIAASDIAFDIDGVVADTFRSFVMLAEKEYGIKIHYEEITEYEFWKILDIDEETAHALIHKLIEQPVEVGIKPVRGAPDVLTRLLKTGPVKFVTARPEADSILRWMTEVLGFPDHNGIVLEATGDHERKAQFLVRENVKYFVEDRLETCYLLEDASIVPILFDQPWNRKPNEFMRVKNWDEISALIDWSA